MMQLIDTHAHLFFKDFRGRLDEIVERSLDSGVSTIICPGLDLHTSHQAIEIAEKYSNVWATVGFHPHEADMVPAGYLKELEALAAHNRVVAIGELGLDYFRDYSDHNNQRRIFAEQLELAQSLELPTVIHNRAADDDTAEILGGDPGPGVLHCYSSSPAFARQMIDLGLHISFTGTVTYGRNDNAATLLAVGLDRVMVETDCPFLAPVPRRGRTNEPAFVYHTAARIAELLELSMEEVARKTTENARRLFAGIDSGAAS